jgi:hypothetical protein
MEKELDISRKGYNLVVYFDISGHAESYSDIPSCVEIDSFEVTGVDHWEYGELRMTEKRKEFFEKWLLKNESDYLHQLVQDV